MWGNEICFAARALRRSPLFTLVAVTILALGIGATGTIWSAVSGVLLRPLAFADPDRLVIAWGFHPEIGRETASLPDFVDWRAQSTSFESLSAYFRQSLTITGTGDPERVIGARVTADFFATLGAEMTVGRPFVAEEDVAGAPGAVVLSHRFWQRRFAGDATALGATMIIGGEPFTVVGVAPPGFEFPSAVELWRPLAIDPAGTGRRGDFLTVVGRLGSGVSPEQAQQDLRTIMARLEQEYPASNASWTADVVPLHEQLVGSARPTLLVLLAAVGLLLLIACANVAHLILARAAGRSGELAMRSALGASRQRLFRELLTETLLLAAVGGGLGLVVAWAGVSLLRRFGPGDLPRLETLAVDWQVVAFSAVVTLGAGLLCGVLPALRLSSGALQASLSSLRSGRFRSRTLLVVGQTALAVMLVVGAGLLLRSLGRLQAIDPGFRVDKVVTARLDLPPSDYPEDHQVAAFFSEVTAGALALPGVDAVGAIDALPLRGANYLSFAIEGRPQPDPNAVQDAEVMTVTPGFFETLAIPLRRGRLIEVRDDGEAEGVAVINERMAEQYWPGTEPIGARVTLSDPVNGPWMRVVGIVGSTRQSDLDKRPYAQLYSAQSQLVSRSMSLVMRVSSGPDEALAGLRGIVRERDPRLPLYATTTFQKILGETLAQPRFNVRLLALFAGAALLLAGIGLYGVLANGIAQRRREFGLRLALGASASQVIGDVARQGLAVVAAGLALGLIGALLLGRLLGSLLYGVTAYDPLTYAATVPILLAVAVVAIWWPARRASRVDPATALREG